MAQKEYKRPDESAMQLVLSHNRGYIAEVVLRLAWNLGLYREEMYNLKWSDISLAEKTVNLPDRSVPMDDDVADCLMRRVKSNHGRKSEFVVSSDKRYTHMAQQSISRVARTALDRGGLTDVTLVDARFSKAVRTVLIRGGMEDTLLKDLYQDETRVNEDTVILRYAEKKGSVTKKDVVRLLSLTETAAYNRLERLIKDGELVRVGQKCFLPGTVVPPEEHYDVLQTHLETVGIAFRQELAELLHLEGRQCGTILRKLVAEGKLVKKGQIYSLPNTEKN